MKKLLLTFIAMIAFLNANSQTKVSEYSSAYFNETYAVNATMPKNDKFTFYIDCASAETKKVDDCGIIIPSDKLDGFINRLRSMEEKFEEWTKTAKENNVTNYDKDFDINWGMYKYYFKYGSNWHFCSATLKPYFKVTSDGQCLVVFNSRKLTASDNRFMTYEGVYIVFTSSDEIENFIASIDANNVYEKQKNQENKDELFK